MSENKISIVDIAKKLGPFACFSYDVIDGSFEYDDLHKYVNLEDLFIGSLETINLEDLHAKLHILRVSQNMYSINLVKKPDGVLGHF